MVMVRFRVRSVPSTVHASPSPVESGGKVSPGVSPSGGRVAPADAAPG